MTPTTSILICTGGWHSYLNQCLEEVFKLPGDHYEVLLLPDDPLNVAPHPRLRVIPTGRIGPSMKKNIGAKEAKGEILAFLDSDAYPGVDWLERGLVPFSDPSVGIVGGPNLTPKEDSLLQQANGLILASVVTSGPFAGRYRVGPAGEGHELPSCNLFIRKSVLEAIGGFERDLWPGEDAKFCFQVMDDLKLRVIYDPRVVVYHHRRKLFLPYLKQIWGYGVTKGMIIGEYSTVRRVAYFLPSAFLVFFVLTPFLWSWYPWRLLAATLLLGYGGAVTLEGVRSGSWPLGFLVSLGIILTHWTYGCAFLAGLVRRQRKKKM